MPGLLLKPSLPPNASRSHCVCLSSSSALLGSSRRQPRPVNNSLWSWDGCNSLGWWPPWRSRLCSAPGCCHRLLSPSMQITSWISHVTQPGSSGLLCLSLCRALGFTRHKNRSVDSERERWRCRCFLLPVGKGPFYLFSKK